MATACCRTTRPVSPLGIVSEESETRIRAVVGSDRANLIERTRRWMEQSIEFVNHPYFGKKSAEQFVAPHDLQRSSSDQRSVSQGIAFVSSLVRCSQFAVEDEKQLFLRMNYLKWRAERARRKLNLNSLRASRLDQIEMDLDEAQRIRNQIVQGNLRLVVSVASKLTTSLQRMSELISEGMLPLIRAVELFDISQGNRFSTYATWAVRNQMIRLLKRDRSRSELQPAEISEVLPWYCINPEDSKTTEESQSLMIAQIRKQLSHLSSRDRQIVESRFGLDGHPAGQSLSEISQQFDLCKERVRQILNRSMAQIRNAIASEIECEVESK